MSAASPVADALAAIVGSAHVVSAPERLEELSRDRSQEAFDVAEVAVAPATAEELSAVVAEADRRGMAVVARGAAWSYTRSHTPSRRDTVLIDIRRLDRIREINAQDMYVTVEPGCTWEQLYLALRDHGVRTPFFGPLSGRFATIGGGLSSNAEFFGSGRYGAATDSVLGVEVVTAGGSIVRTGTGAVRDGSPFARSFGPDLTGLFLADSGAMGIKSAATLSLVPSPALTVAASFAFDDLPTLVATMREMARTRLAAELYGFGGLYHALLRRLGFAFVDGVAWTLHATVDGADEATAETTLEVLRAIGARGGREVPGSVPLAIRSDPWGATRAMFNGFEGAGDAVHLPVHALMPFSKAEEAIARFDRLVEQRQAIFDEHGIGTWALPAASGKDYLHEVTVYFPRDADRESRAAALALRHEIAHLFDDFGAVHMQIGRFYDYAPMIEDSALALVRGIKQLVDPQANVNPGALGL